MYRRNRADYEDRSEETLEMSYHTNLMFIEENSKYDRDRKLRKRRIRLPSKKAILSIVIGLMFLYFIRKPVLNFFFSNEPVKATIIHGPPHIVARYKDFFTWTRRNNIKLHPNIRLRWYGEDIGLGLAAVQDLKAQDEAFMVPSKFVFSIYNDDIKAKDMIQFLKTNFDTADNFMLTAIAFFIERTHNTSIWQPYFRTFPFPRNTYYWVEEDIKWLQNPSLESKNSSLVHKYLREWDYIKLGLLETEYKDILNHISNKEAIWAFSVLLERGVRIQNRWVLAPYLDLLNNALQWNPEKKKYNDISNLRFDEDNNLRHYVNADYKENDQLLISYSLHMSTPDFFLRYGIAMENNMNDFVTLRVDPVDELPIRKQILNEFDDLRVHYIGASDMGISNSFLRAVFVCLANEAELNQFNGKLTTKQKTLAKSSILNSMIKLAKSWPTSLESDMKLMEDYKELINMGYNARTALRLRVSSKKFLIRLINALNSKNTKNIPNDTKKSVSTPSYEIYVQRISSIK